MGNSTTVPIDSNWEFAIERKEGWGYVQNSVVFDEQVIELIKKEYKNNPEQLEGSPSHVTYYFKLLEMISCTITFIAKYDTEDIAQSTYTIDAINKKVIY